jgi:tetratricopeptide (TPR) repeat protein
MMMRLCYILIALTGLFIAACQPADDLEAEYARAYFQAGKEALKVKDVPAAITNLEIANELSGLSSLKLKEDIRFNLAYAYYYSASYDKAIHYLNTIPSSYDVLWLKGLSLRYSGKHDEALLALKDAKTLLPTTNDDAAAKIQMSIGLTFFDADDKKQAKQIFEELAANNLPQTTRYEAYTNLGLIEIANDNYQAAIKNFLYAKEIKNTPYVCTYLAEALLKNGNEKEAKVLIEEILNHPDLSVHESDMVQVLLLELQDVDAGYFRAKLDEPDKLAEITKVNAENSVKVAEVRLDAIRAEYEAKQQQRTLLWLSAAILVLAVALGVYLYRVWRHKQALDRHMTDIQAVIDECEAAVGHGID